MCDYIIDATDLIINDLIVSVLIDRNGSGVYIYYISSANGIKKMKELADQMNVSQADVQMLLTGVVNSIISDGAAAAFISSTEDDRVALTEAYIVAAVKKFAQFHTTYLTNPEARQSLINIVAGIL